MSKRKFASAALAVLILGSGAAVAAPSSYPSGVDETAPLAIPLTAERNIATHPSMASAFPSSPSEAPAFSLPGTRSVHSQRLGARYGSAFPSSATETGARM